MDKILSYDEIQEHRHRIHESNAMNKFSPDDIERQLSTIEYYRKKGESLCADNECLHKKVVTKNIEIATLNQRIGELKFCMNVMISTLRSIESVMDNSNGVEGWHLNGAIATWSELGLDAEVEEALSYEADRATQ